MGIDITVFRKLVELSKRLDRPGKGTLLMLGRQGIHVLDEHQELAEQCLIENGISDLSFRDLTQNDGFSERLFRRLGFGVVESLDYSDFEGSSYVADLGAPISDELRGKFDVIFDGGTIEHIFNVPEALNNVFHMLRPNGLFASVNGMNSYWWHGLYQLSPELAYSYWERNAGCEVVECCAMPKDPRKEIVDLPDPGKLGRRLMHLEDQIPKDRVYLYYVARKSAGAKLAGSVYQSDYVADWTKSAEAGVIHDTI